ncbi:hypothetical protein D3C73_1496310 [compost metagenome]
MQHHTTDQLYVKMAFAQNPLRSLTHNSESIGQDIIQFFSLFQTALQYVGLRAQLLV